MFETVEEKKYAIPSYVYGYGITCFDIDEALFHTFAQVKVIKNGQIVRILDNQQFNEDKLGEDESYGFGDFRNAKHFMESSKPIIPIIRRLKNILHLVTTKSEGSRVVFLTARSDFDNNDMFLNPFRKYGIDIDSRRMYVERSGNLPNGTVAEKKKQTVTDYLASGKYRRVRLIDDNRQNLVEFLSIKKTFSSEIVSLIRENHSLEAGVDPLQFSGYLVDAKGNMEVFYR